MVGGFLSGESRAWNIGANFDLEVGRQRFDVSS
jgi:hypothetical protein